jgi:hypothetical protein
LRERTGEESPFFDPAVQTADYGYLSGEMQSGSTESLRAFIVSNTGLREISVPTVMADIMLQASPAPVIEVQSYPVRQRTLSLDRVFKDFDTLVLPLGTSLPSTGTGFDGLDITVTPGVYKALNDQFSFTAPENTKTFPSNIKGGLLDASKGGYNLYYFPTVSNYLISDIYRSGIPLYNAVWPIKGQQPVISVWFPDYTGTVKPKRVNRPGLIFDENRVERNNAYIQQRFITAWDWYDPKYCRFMLEELGFTAQDFNVAVNPNL